MNNISMYQPLGYDSEVDSNSSGTFRVLELLPGSSEERIYCRLIHTSLQEKPSYEAISYFWGTSTPRHEIICDSTRFQITANLYSALRRFRRVDASRFLWADQICINQDDVDERNHQIGYMRAIYANAVRTLIWLGDSDPDFPADEVRVGFRLAETLAGFYRARRNNHKDTPVDQRDLLELSPADLADAGLPRLMDAAWLHFNKIWWRSWFDRVWVIQELVVSRRATLYCREFGLDWDDYDTALSCADELRVFYFLNAGAKQKLDLPRLRRQWRLLNDGDKEGGKVMGLAQLLMEFSRYSASDCRDKIYALVGLASREEQKCFVPDYRLREDEVFLRTTVALLEWEENLDVLSLVSLSASRDSASGKLVLPGWIPRFDNCHHIPMTSEWDRPGRKPPRFRATGHSVSRPVYTPDKRQLGLQGYILDTIEEVGSAHVIREQKIGSPFAAILDGAVLLHVMATGEALTRRLYPRFSEQRNTNKLGNSRKYAITGESVSDVFWQTMIGGCRHGEEYDTIREKYITLRQKYPMYNMLYAFRLTRYRWVCAALLGSILALILLREKLGRPRPIDLRFFEHQCMVHDRRLFRTRGGLLGLGAVGCRAGDGVFLVKGGRVPVVLRRGDGDRSEEGRCRLVGDAYVHGIMFGDAFDEAKCERIWLV